MAGPMSFVMISRGLNGLMSTTAIIILLVFALTARAASVTTPPDPCPTGFANFGDELTDTGNALTLDPYFLDAELSPYGQTFFGKPAKRFSDGRLVPDFFSLAFGKPLLDPYLKATSYGYQYGINFAEAGATAVPNPNLLLFDNPVSLYPYQVKQFKRFFNSVVATESQSSCSNFYSALPVPSGTSWVSQWLFTIGIGRNDLYNRLDVTRSYFVFSDPNFLNGSNPLPDVVQSIIQTIQELYGVGARKFLIFGIPAEGCTTALLTRFASPTANNALPKDNFGCLARLNNIVQAFNTALLAAIQALRPTLPGANVAFFDYYAAHIQVLLNPRAFGFTQTTATCCGGPGDGTLNYNYLYTCGRPFSNVCPNPKSVH